AFRRLALFLVAPGQDRCDALRSEPATKLLPAFLAPALGRPGRRMQQHGVSTGQPGAPRESIPLHAEIRRAIRQWITQRACKEPTHPLDRVRLVMRRQGDATLIEERRERLPR